MRRKHPEDYLEYVKGCDIASFDIYPVVHNSPEIAGKLWFVAEGAKRLSGWSGPERIVWNCLECTHIGNPAVRATPEQVRCEAWMSLIHGSRGLIYFVHEWKPRFNESALLDNPEMLAAVTTINRQITQLAPVLNSPDVGDEATVTSEPAEVPVALAVKRSKDSLHLFAVGMRDGKTSATFSAKNLPGRRTVEVLGEDRTLTAENGVFTDQFAPWAVHLYRMKP